MEVIDNRPVTDERGIRLQLSSTVGPFKISTGAKITSEGGGRKQVNNAGWRFYWRPPAKW